MFVLSCLFIELNTIQSINIKLASKTLQKAELSDNFKKQINKTITELTPVEIRNLEKTLPFGGKKEIIDCLQIYNTIDTKTSIKTIQEDNRTAKNSTNFTIWSRNIGGALKKKLEQDSSFVLDILLKNPTIIAIQEHQKNKLNTKTFKTIMKIENYTLLAHSKAEYIQNKREGRASGGLATWIKTSVLHNYNTSVNKNTEYIQSIILSPKKHNTTTEKPIHILNGYILKKYRRQLSKKVPYTNAITLP